MNGLARLALPLLAALTLAGGARAAGGDYVLVGGTAIEQSTVARALAVSAFDWSIVPLTVTIHIVRGIPTSFSTPGQIWLDGDLLDAGEFSWGAVQMEYGQQVEYATLDPALRTALVPMLGGSQWCHENPRLPTAASACERFAAMVAWSYWPTAANCMRPEKQGAWSTGIDPRTFRRLLTILIAAPDSIDAPGG